MSFRKKGTRLTYRDQKTKRTQSNCVRLRFIHTSFARPRRRRLHVAQHNVGSPKVSAYYSPPLIPSSGTFSKTHCPLLPPRRSTSISNVAFSGTPLTRRSSERELSDGPKKRATSAGGLDRSEGMSLRNSF